MQNCSNHKLRGMWEHTQNQPEALDPGPSKDLGNPEPQASAQQVTKPTHNDHIMMHMRMAVSAYKCTYF